MVTLQAYSIVTNDDRRSIRICWEMIMVNGATLP
jgi:hypothetical protein